MKLHGKNLSRLELERYSDDLAAAGGVARLCWTTVPSAVSAYSNSGQAPASPSTSWPIERWTSGLQNIRALLRIALRHWISSSRITRECGPARTRLAALVFWVAGQSRVGSHHWGRKKTRHGVQVSIAPHHATRSARAGGQTSPRGLGGYGETWDEDRCLLWVDGEVRQAAVFGEHLRRIEESKLRSAATKFRLHDTVRDFGFDRTPRMFLYQLNLGWPLIDIETRFGAPITGARSQSPTVASQRASNDVMPGPVSGFLEQVYGHGVEAGFIRTHICGCDQ